MKSRWVLLYFDEPIEPAPPGTTMHRVYLAGEADAEIARLKTLAKQIAGDYVHINPAYSSLICEIDKEGA